MQVYSARLAVLTDRLDPTHYRPDLVEIESAVRSLGASNLDGWVARSGIGHTAAVTPHYADPDEAGVPFVSGAAIKHGTLDVAGAERVRIESHNGVMAGSRLRPGMLVAVRKGDLGNAGVVPPSLPEANCSSEVLFFHLRDPDRAGYLASYFNSRHGRAVFLRQQRGMMIPSISLYDVPDIVVPAPVSEVQAYIGSKVRQAEALREWARGMRQAAQSFVETSFAVPAIPSMRERPRRMPVAVLDSDSLDPNFAVAEQGHRLMAAAIPIERMKEACRSGDPIRADERKPGPFPYHGASGPIDWHDDWNIDGDFVLVAQDGSIGRACVVRGRAWANNHVWILSLQPEFDLDAVAFFLNDYYPYWTGLTTGSVVPKVLADNLMRVHVPAVVARARTEVGEPLRRAKVAVGSARSLVTAARFLVEALIERKVTEAELIQAGKDPDADCALLARLAEDGLDGVGAPLFSDLDGLAELIAEATADR